MQELERVNSEQSGVRNELVACEAITAMDKGAEADSKSAEDCECCNKRKAQWKIYCLH